VVGGCVVAFWITHREEAPVTHRKRFMVFSDEFVRSVTEPQYKQLLLQFRGQILSPNDPLAVAVEGVGRRIAQAAGLGHLDWKFHVIDTPQANAFVTPGGKVFVFKGLFKVTKSPDDLAAVLGHEVGHVVARHIAEDMSKNMFRIVPMLLVGWVLNFDPRLLDVFYTYFIRLPSSRTHETEADYIGLQLMAQACFDPSASPIVFQRLGKLAGDSKVLSYLTTHPAPSDRARKLQEWLPHAMAIYQDSCARISGHLPVQTLEKAAYFEIQPGEELEIPARRRRS